MEMDPLTIARTISTALAALSTLMGIFRPLIRRMPEGPDKDSAIQALTDAEETQDQLQLAQAQSDAWDMNSAGALFLPT